jgi:hypothetical protein
MIVDADHLWMIAGANGGGSKVPLQPSANGYRVDGAFHLALSPSVCSAYVTYSDLDFSFDAAGRLRGTSDGTLTTIAGDVATSLPVKMSVAGVDDVAPPRLDLFANDIADPFSLFTLVSSEPLPLAEAPVLRAAGGDVVFLSPSSGDDFTAQFTTPPTLLRYGESYGIDIAGMVDFAGNTAQLGNVLSFTTRDPPPLVAADGFESVTAATLGGGQMLSSAAGDSTISGARSLYLPRADAGSAATTQFALRLPVAPGSTVVRFAYQYVNPGVGAPARFAVASVGRSIATMAPSPGAGATTSGSINGAPATLGPVATATINLPADAAGEIVVARLLSPSSPCSAPLPPTQGMIIDDLRTE